MKDHAEDYKIYLEKELNYSSETVKNYLSDIEQFNSFLNKYQKNFKNIDKDLIRNYLKFLNEKKLESKSISRKLSSLRNFYDFLKDICVIKENVFKNISNPKIAKKLPNYLNTIEIEDMLKSIKLVDFFSVRNYLIIELIYSSGVRLSELINIKLKDINISDKQIKILGKGNKERMVCIGACATDAINLYVDKYRSLNNCKKSEFLFISKNGSQLSKSMVDKIIKTVAKKSGIKKNISAHIIRHSFATDLLNEGASIETVKELLGHESLSTTQIYTHVSNEKLRDTYLKTHPRNIK